ncbi:MAG: HlyD family efflux transporter periplasmic adaptor subunit, partial [Pirellulaceae bacterium]|nr:HlyD family efflux transporter periplasmic adaptor subunit [Pirellulaceae bacterium]
KQVQQVKAEIDRHQIVSPLNGRIMDIMREKGEWVEAGKVVFRVIGISKLKAEGFVDSKFVSDNLNGSKVQLLVVMSNGKEETFSGKIKFVSDEVDPVNQQVRFWAEIDNLNQRLNPGKRGRLIISP